MNKTVTNNFLLFKHMETEKRWRVEKGDLIRFHDYLLIYFQATPLFDKELLEQMEYGEFENKEFQLISFFFNIDHSDEKGLFLTEKYHSELPALRKKTFMFYLYPIQGSQYDECSVLPISMKVRIKD